MSHPKFCPSCNSFTYGKKETQGSMGIEIFLWLLLIVPGIIYSLWRQTSKKKICTECGAGHLIACDSPKAKKELGQDYEKNLADFVANRPPSKLVLIVGCLLVSPIYLGAVQVYPKSILLLTALGVCFYVFKKNKRTSK